MDRGVVYRRIGEAGWAAAAEPSAVRGVVAEDDNCAEVRASRLGDG